MSILGKFVKQPLEKESYSIDFAPDLIVQDGVASATVVVTPPGLALDSFLVIGNRVKTFLSGGTAGMKHKVTVTATTDDGRVLQDEFIVSIKDF